MKKQEIAIFGALVTVIVLINLNSDIIAKTIFALEDNDPLRVVSHAESLDDYKKHNVLYIVARVETKVDGKPFWRFIDAQAFNKMVLGGLVSANDQQPGTFNDPVSQLPIVGVEYLIVKKDNKGAVVLEKLCSYNDLFMNTKHREFWKDTFRINQYEDPKTQAKGWLNLGYHYLANKEYETALDYFLLAFEQRADQEISDQARQQIGKSFGKDSLPQDVVSGRDRE